MDDANLPSGGLPYDHADTFVSLENLPIYCKLCKQHSIGEPCWTHARTISDRVVTPLAIASLPEVLYLEPTDEASGKAVHTSVFIPLHTVFGPLTAPLYKQPLSPSNPCQTLSQGLEDFQLENDYFCNWLKHVRTATDPAEQNLAVCFNGTAVMFVAIRSIQPHEELKVYLPLSTRKTESVNLLPESLPIEFGIVSNEIPHIAAVNNDDLLASSLEFDESNPAIYPVFIGGAEVAHDAASPECAEMMISTEFCPEDLGEPEIVALASDTVLHPLLPAEHDLRVRRSGESQSTRKTVKRTAAERPVLKRGKSGLRRPDAPTTQRLANQQTSLNFVNESLSLLHQIDSLPVDLIPGGPGGVFKAVRKSRLSSVRKRKSEELDPGLPSSDNSPEADNGESDSISAVDTFVAKKKRGKESQDTSVNSKRVTRRSTTTVRPEVIASASDSFAALQSTPDDTALSETDILMFNAIADDGDEDYAPSDASEAESLPAKTLRSKKQKSTPNTELSSVETLVKVERVVKPAKLIKPLKSKTTVKQSEPPSIMRRGNRIFRRDYEAYVYRYPCPHCPLKFYSTRLLNLHKYQHEEGDMSPESPSDLKCIDCGYTGKDAMGLAKHTDTHGKNVGEMTELASVEPEHRSHPHCYFYVCEVQDCMRWFCTETLWRQHRTLHHPLLPVEIESLQCTVCDYLATDAQDLAHHTTVHGRRSTEKVTCPVCFHKVDAFHRHLRRRHPEYLKMVSLDFPLACRTCPLRFVTEFTLSKHRRSCKRKLNQCYMCAKQFETKPLLQEHYKIHMVDNKYPCPNCDFLTPGFQYITKHMEHRHELSRIRVCEICQMVVNSSKRLQIHMKTHNQTMNFLCDLCGNRFNTGYSLNQHRHYVHRERLKAKMARKAQEKKEKGEIGKTPGTSKSDLALVDYPYRCDQCQTGFLKPGLLARHMHVKHIS